MVEFVGNWGERPESAVARWRNDVTAAKSFVIPKKLFGILRTNLIRTNGSGCFVMQDTNIYNVCSFERRL